MKSIQRFAIPLSLLGLVIAIMLPYAPPNYINGDSGIFLYAGREITLGKLLYLDVWDHKGPLIFYINALGLLSGSRWGVWALECVSLFTAVLGGYTLMKNLLNRNYALLGTVAWVFSFATIIGGGNFTEEYSLPISFLSLLCLYCYLKGFGKIYLFLIGAAMGLNLMLRPNNIGVQLAISLVILVDGLYQSRARQTAGNIGLIVLGLLAVLTPIFVFFSQNGSLAEFINATFTYNFHYLSATDDPKFAALPLFTAALGWPFWFAIAGWFVALKEMIAKTNLWPNSMMLFIILGFPLEICLDTLSARPYVHYVLLLLPYIGILSAFFMYTLVRFCEGTHKLARMTATVVCISAVAFSIWNSWEFIGKLAAASTRINENSEIIHFVKENSLPTESVLVWGQELSINFLADRSAPSSFAFQTFFLDRGTVTPGIEHKFMTDLETHKPTLIVITDALPFSETNFANADIQLEDAPPESRDLFRAFSEFVNRNYQQIRIIEHRKIFKLDR